MVICDSDEVNFGLCVPNDNQELCSDANYKFKYIPPDDTDRNGLNPAIELNSIRYRGEENGVAELDQNGHLIYNPEKSDMKWLEHKFLVGDNGLNLNDSYKELHINDPNEDIREGYTEFTDKNTFRFL